MNRTALVLSFLVTAGVLMIFPGTPEASVHPNEDFHHYVDSGAQRGLLFWDNNRQELVIQPGYRINTIDIGEDEFTPDGNLEAFTSFAWVLPLPTLPDKYQEVDPGLFDDIAKFTAVESRLPAGSDGRDTSDTGSIISGSDSDEIEFLEALEVGDYKIQTIKANGEEGKEELADWLKNNGFGEVDERILRYYVEKEFYWVAIKLEAKDGLPPTGQLKPLHVSFESAYPVYPFKINDKQGAFDLQLWVITRDAIDLVKSQRFGIKTPEQNEDHLMQRNRETSYIKLPESVRAIADGSDDLKKLRIGKVFVYRFAGRDLEVEGGFDVALLMDELHFQFERSAAEKPEKEVEPLPDEDEREEGTKDSTEAEAESAG